MHYFFNDWKVNSLMMYSTRIQILILEVTIIKTLMLSDYYTVSKTSFVWQNLNQQCVSFQDLKSTKK